MTIERPVKRFLCRYGLAGFAGRTFTNGKVYGGRDVSPLEPGILYEIRDDLGIARIIGGDGGPSPHLPPPWSAPFGSILLGRFVPVAEEEEGTCRGQR